MARTDASTAAPARVLVTGAAGGFGSPTVTQLRERGAQVVGLDVAGGDGVLVCDITDTAAVEAAVVEAVRRVGGAGARGPHPRPRLPHHGGRPPPAPPPRL